MFSREFNKLLCALYLLFVFNFNLFCKCEDNRVYKLIPESNQYDLNEGDEFFVGFEEIAEDKTYFDHCYYYSDTISNDYVIQKNTNYYSKDFRRPNSNTSECSFRLKKVDDKTPLKWTFVVHDKVSGKNFSEEISINFYYNVAPLLETVNVIQGASYLNYLIKSSNKTFVKCVLSINNFEVELDLDSENTTFPTNTSFEDRLRSLGRKECGFKVTNAKPEDPKEMFLIATDDKNRKYRSKIKISLLPIDNYSVNRTVEEYLGSSTRVVCGREIFSATNSEQQYCLLYNSKGELISKNQLCDYKIEILTLADLGVWHCWVGYRFIMEPLYFTVEIKEKKSGDVELWQDERSKFVSIGCKIKNYKNLKADFCKFTRPDGVNFKTYLGAASKRYTSLKTDLNQGICGIEIKKPLISAEKGAWKCEIHLGTLDKESAGGFINLQKTNRPITSSRTSSNNDKKQNVHLTSPFKVECQVPYSSNFCYITSPNGTQFEPKYPSKSALGECELEVKKAQISDNGTWTCFFARENGIPDEKITVEVSIVEVKIIYSDQAEVGEDGSVVLFCNTGGIPLEYCRFSSPSNEIFSLKLTAGKVLHRMDYYGRGLDFGDCGIEIFRANYETDNGKWVCHISPQRSPYSRKIHLQRELLLTVHMSGLHLVESLGVSFGIILLLVLITGFIVLHRMKKRERLNGSNVEYVSNSLTDSGEINVILDREQNNYNTNLKND